MRLQAELPPMTPTDARLPMHEEVSHEDLTCNSCHEAHDFNLTVAAVAPVCASCHNDHIDTPRSDFKIGDVMGGVVIRIPVDS